FVNLGSNQLRSVSATLHSNLRQTRQTVQTHEVTNSVDIGELAHGEVFVGGDATRAVNLDTSLLANQASQWGSSNTRGPDLDSTGQSVLRVVLHVLVGDGLFIDIGNHRVEAYIYAQLLQSTLGLASQTLTEWWQHLWCAITQEIFAGAGKNFEEASRNVPVCKCTIRTVSLPT